MVYPVYQKEIQKSMGSGALPCSQPELLAFPMWADWLKFASTAIGKAATAVVVEDGRPTANVTPPAVRTIHACFPMDVLAVMSEVVVKFVMVCDAEVEDSLDSKQPFVEKVLRPEGMVSLTELLLRRHLHIRSAITALVRLLHLLVEQDELRFQLT